MPNRCCVADCQNSKTKRPELTFYSFPGKPYEKERKAMWIEVIAAHNLLMRPNGKPWQHSKYSMVCSKHFVSGKTSSLQKDVDYVPSVFPKWRRNQTNIVKDINKEEVLSCYVKGCTRRTSVPGEIEFHRFPKSPELAQEWRKVCQIVKGASFPRVCSSHFAPDAFETDLSAELLGLPPTKKLKQDAVPTLRLPPEASVPIEVSKPKNPTSILRARDDQQTSKTAPTKVIEFFRPTSKLQFPRPISKLPPNVVFGSGKSLEEAAHKRGKNRNIISDYCNDFNDDGDDSAWQAKMERMQERIDCLERENKELIIENHTLRKKLSAKDAETSSNSVKNSSKNVVLPISEDKQLDVLADEALIRLFPLVGLSKTWYSFLRSGLEFSLPSLEVLQKWVAEKCTLDLVCDVIHFMENLVEQSVSPDNICIMTIQSSPTSKQPVMRLKGLIKAWEQPIVTQSEYEFDQELLLNAIEAAEGHGYNVVAIEDTALKNTSFWCTLIGDSAKPGFPNPVDEKRIVWIVPNGELDTLRHLLSDDAMGMFKECNYELF